MSGTVALVFNAYQESLRVSVNGRPAPRYGSLNTLLDKPFDQWKESIFPALSKALNDQYRLEFTGPKLETVIMERLASDYKGCLEFSTKAPELNLSTGDRLAQMDELREQLGEKRITKKFYLEMHVGSGLLGEARRFQSLTGEPELLPDESYDCMLPSSMSHWGGVTLDAVMQRWNPGQIQDSRNTLNVLMASDQREAGGMLQNLRTAGGNTVLLLMDAQGNVDYLGFQKGILIFHVPFSAFNAFLEPMIDHYLLTPLLRTHYLSGMEGKAQWGASRAELVENRLKEITGIEPYYVVQPIEGMQEGQHLRLPVRRVPGGSMPQIMVRCDPEGYVTFDGTNLIATDELEKPERVHIEIFAADRADPISRQSFYINVDTTPTTMKLSTPKGKMMIREQVQLRLEIEHVKKNTPRTTVWRSSDTRVAEVDENGLVTALSPGQAVLTAIKGDLEASCPISVYRSLDAFDLSSRMIHASLTNGNAQKMPIVVYAPQDQYDGINIRCDSGNSRIAYFEPARLSDTERSAVPAGKMILCEGYIHCAQEGKTQLMFYQNQGGRDIKSYVSVQVDQKGLPAPAETAKDGGNAEKIVKIAAIALSVLSVFLITTDLGLLVSILAIGANIYSMMKYRLDRTWVRTTSRAVSIIVFVLHVLLVAFR